MGLVNVKTRLVQRRRVVFAVLLLVLCAGAVAIGLRGRSQHPYIAYVGRYTDVYLERVHELALEYFSSLQRSGPARLRVRSFSLQDYESPRALYSKLADDPNCVAVIDNLWGSDLLSAWARISESNLPVISINADKTANDYQRRVVFLGADDYVTDAVLGYLRQKHEQDYVIGVYEENFWSSMRFARMLKAAPFSLADSHLIRVATSTVNDAEAVQVTGQILKHAAAAAEAGKRLVIALNVHAPWGQRIVKSVDIPGDDSAYHNTLLIGGTYVFSQVDSSNFFGFNGTELLLVTVPTDTLSPGTLRAMRTIGPKLDLRSSNDRRFGFFVQRCSDAISLIYGQIGKRALPPEEMREQLRQRIAELRPGLYSLGESTLTLDDQLMAVRAPRLERHDRLGARSNPLQVGRGGGLVPNLYVGVDILNISRVELSDGTFAAEFIVTLQGEDVPREILEKLANDLVFPNGREVQVESLPGSGAASAEGGVHKSEYRRCSGVFTAQFDGDQFPFDSQFFPIQIAVPESGADLVISSGVRGYAQSTSADGEAPMSLATGWRTRDVIVGVRDSITLSTASAVQGSGALGVTQISTVIVMQRDLLRPLATIVLPLVGMGVCASLILFMKDLSISHVGEVSVGVFLALIGYTVSYNKDIAPAMPGISKADWLLYSTATVVTLQLFVIILGNAVASSKMQAVQGSNWITPVRWVLMAGFLIAAAMSLIRG